VQEKQTSDLKPTVCFNHMNLLQFVGTDVKHSKVTIRT